MLPCDIDRSEALRSIPKTGYAAIAYDNDLDDRENISGVVEK